MRVLLMAAALVVAAAAGGVGIYKFQKDRRAARTARAAALAPPPLPFAIEGVSTVSIEAQKDPLGVMLGMWAVEPRASISANSDIGEARLRELQQNVLPGMAGLVVAYNADHSVVTTAQGRELSRARWKVQQLSPPSVTLEVTAGRGEVTSVPLEVVGPNQLRTRLNGFTLVLQRAHALPDEPRTSDLRMPQKPVPSSPPTGTTRGVVIPGAFSTPGGSAPRDQALEERNRRLAEENARTEAMNQQVREINKGPSLYVKPGSVDPTLPPSDSSNRDALLKDKNLDAENRRTLQKNRRVEERNRRLLNGQ